ncbi:MAG: aminoglycoside phosphotransferase [Gemmatimonadetes bacterium 13_1_40CM_70_11]|nr:MAG: aminoglycoside phosphotransferase [Gemmatimonadetes bacterium 13_1_40CM_70_11]
MNVPTLDPFGARADPRLPFVARALAAEEVQGLLRAHLAGPAWGLGRLAVLAIRVVRHKPGRRCLIEYDVEVPGAAQPPEPVTLVAKVRSRGADTGTFQLLELLRQRGFGPDSPDGISVPEPVAAIPELGMWLQRKVGGATVTALLARPGGVALARQLAAAAHKLHGARVPTARRHTLVDELRILRGRLTAVAQARPEWGARLERLLQACDGLGDTIPRGRSCGIHRDFYADHAVVNGRRLYLLDFDLYCKGDPALDIGNCLGHITEQSLRVCGDPDALADREAALTEAFAELAGEETRAAVRGYALLTLVRHISLSTQFPERRPFTEALLDLCEARLGVGRHASVE